MSRFLRRPAPPVASEGKESDEKSDEVHPTEPPPPKTHTLITTPSASCTLPEPPTFTESQARVMTSVKEHLLQLHGELESKDPAYVPWERRWIENPSTARRYAKAVNYDEAQAKKRAADTLVWRREFKPDLIEPDSVKREGESGKHVLSGFDNHGRTCLYLRPGLENTRPNENQIRYLVFGLERAIDLCPQYQDKICLVIDYRRATNATQPNFSTQLKVLHILQNHYPERLGLAIIVNVPWFLSTFFAAISPFLDPNTRTKIQMLRSPVRVKEFIPPDMLDYAFGGTWNYEFEPESYWRQVLDACGIAKDGTRTRDSASAPSDAAEEATEASQQPAPPSSDGAKVDQHE